MTSNFQNTITAAARLAKVFTVSSILAASSLMLAQTPAALLPLPPPVVSTVPSNGDVNPYGVVFIGRNVSTNGVLQPGDVLVSNFNNSANLQGTGTTITRIAANGQPSTF